MTPFLVHPVSVKAKSQSNQFQIFIYISVLTYVQFWAVEYKKTYWCLAGGLRVGNLTIQYYDNWKNVYNSTTNIKSEIRRYKCNRLFLINKFYEAEQIELKWVF